METLNEFYEFNKNHIYLTMVVALVFPVFHDIGKFLWGKVKQFLKMLI